jgi:hypothetical protein
MMHYVYLSNNYYAIVAQGDNKMEPKQNKNEALEALDFIINVLREHEKDLDRLIGQLGTITESLGETGEITGKFEKIEDRITNLQREITNLTNCLAGSRDTISPSYTPTNPVNVKCRKWEDFKTMASSAETVSYLFKTSENTFQANALKDGKIVSFSGEFPHNASLLKLWLSRELDVSEEIIFEGVLNIG